MMRRSARSRNGTSVRRVTPGVRLRPSRVNARRPCWGQDHVTFGDREWFCRSCTVILALHLEHESEGVHRVLVCLRARSPGSKAPGLAAARLHFVYSSPGHRGRQYSLTTAPGARPPRPNRGPLPRAPGLDGGRLPTRPVAPGPGRLCAVTLSQSGETLCGVLARSAPTVSLALVDARLGTVDDGGGEIHRRRASSTGSDASFDLHRRRRTLLGCLRRPIDERATCWDCRPRRSSGPIMLSRSMFFRDSIICRSLRRGLRAAYSQPEASSCRCLLNADEREWGYGAGARAVGVAEHVNVFITSRCSGAPRPTTGDRHRQFPYSGAAGRT